MEKRCATCVPPHCSLLPTPYSPLPTPYSLWHDARASRSRGGRSGRCAMACGDERLALVVLRAGMIGVEVEQGTIDVDRVGQARRLLDHPGESDVGEARFGLGIAAADIRMVAGKPNLLEPHQRRAPVGE